MIQTLLEQRLPVIGGRITAADEARVLGYSDWINADLIGPQPYLMQWPLIWGRIETVFRGIAHQEVSSRYVA
jgi:hypothetical protein